jgi:hypothetical protein
MAETRVEPPSEGCSEERTEPFSQSDLDARLKSIRVEAPVEGEHYASVPLDKLQVEDHHHKQGIRILVRPLTRSRSVSPGSDNCQWLALRAEVASQEQPQHQVLAVTQTSKDINFSMRIPPEILEDDSPRPPLWCELYYDPASDDQILYNRSDTPIALSRVTDQPTATPPLSYGINPGTTKALTPGTWRISVRETAVLDFRILERRPATLLQEESFVIEDVSSVSSADMLNSSGKRSFVSDDDVAHGKKPRTLSDVGPGKDDNGVVMFLPAAADVDPIVLPLPHGDKGKEVTVFPGQPLLDVKAEETVQIPGFEIAGGCELDKYQLTKRDQIASTSLSSVFTAKHSNVPHGIVTVKVLKTRMTSANAKPQDSERNVIRQADMWLREYKSQDNLRHNHIVKLYGGDARYLSLYMEHIDAPDLSSKLRWLDTGNDMFKGARADGIRILRDIASALHYIHSRKLVHNDIKPGNILYSPERGAVLCDFGLSTHTSNPPTTGGTPYYVPPEFIGQKLRGPPSDVWALGITMLYVLRKIPFPDARGRQKHPKKLYWMIADLNRQPTAQRATPSSRPPSAVEQMRIWLGEINEVKNQLNLRDKLEWIIGEMLVLNPAQRISTARLMQELYKEQQPTNR